MRNSFLEPIAEFNLAAESADVPDVEVQAGESLPGRLKRWWAQSTDVGKKIEALKARADGWVEHIVRLAAVFIVQTVVLPLLFLWAMVRLYRVLSAPFYARNLHGRAEHHVPQLTNET